MLLRSDWRNIGYVTRSASGVVLSDAEASFSCQTILVNLYRAVLGPGAEGARADNKKAGRKDPTMTRINRKGISKHMSYTIKRAVRTSCMSNEKDPLALDR